MKERRVLCVKVKPFFKWFDLWIGLYINPKESTFYLCFFTLGVQVHWWYETNDDRSFKDGWRQAIQYAEALMKLGDDAKKALELTKEVVE